MEKVLLVEDSVTMQKVVTSLIEKICDLQCAATLADAAARLKSNEYSLVILDVVLPDGDGFKFCETLRAEERFKNLPIIFLTSKTEVEDRVRGYNLGADDYVVKPLEPKEFIARIEAKLRRRSAAQTITHLTKPPFKLDLTAQKAYLQINGTEQNLDLTPIEYKLLANFLKNDGKTFSRDDLRAAIWGADVHVSSHTVDTHISSLRKKLKNFGTCVKAVVRQGYCFNMPPKQKAA